MSDLKRLLRTAREALAKKEWRQALLTCKEALAVDKNCYEAYVFVGKAAFHLQEFQQAAQAYQRAADLDSSSPLAWQGLAEVHTETGAWAEATECHARLYELAMSVPEGDPLAGKRLQFLRRQAEAHSKAGQLQEAEACWAALADAADARCLTLQAHAPPPLSSAAGEGREGEAAVAAEAARGAASELLDCLCLLADVQLAIDDKHLEARVAERLAALANDPQAVAQGVSEAGVRLAVEGEWAEEALELETDRATHTLRRIIALAPPAPRYAPYYDALLRRLRKAIQTAPPGTMERHMRRMALLAAARDTMVGRVYVPAATTDTAVAANTVSHTTCSTTRGEDSSTAPEPAGQVCTTAYYALLVSGCCSTYPYEAALAMLEVESEVTDAGGEGLHAATPTACTPFPPRSPPLPFNSSSPSPAAPAGPGGCSPLALGDTTRIAVRLSHAFPWSPTAAVHLALALKRRGFAEGRVPVAGSVPVARLGPVGSGRAVVVPATAFNRRKHITKELLSGLRRGASSASGWVALAQMLLEDGAAEAALDAAKQGLRYVAHREHVGKERMAGAALLLRLLAGRCLLAMGRLDEAQALLESLAVGVSEGQLAFGELAGIPPLSISQQATRYLAHVALARGDRASARQQLEALVGRELMGRVADRAGSWAHAELGCVMAADGDLQAARSELSMALKRLAEEDAAHRQHVVAMGLKYAPESASYGPSAVTAAQYRMKLGRVLWRIGGEHRSGRGEGSALAQWLAAAAVPSRHQAEAFEWLGHWYWRQAGDPDKAARCYQRALQEEPGRAGAGEALVSLLQAQGHLAMAVALCRELAEKPGAPAATTTAAAVVGAECAVCDTLQVGVGPTSSTFWAKRRLPALLLLLAQQGSTTTTTTTTTTPTTTTTTAAGEAIAATQLALRESPQDAGLWQLLGAAYQGLGRHTAALKSYGRSLELQPGQLYCLLQRAALQYELGELQESLASYQAALHLDASHPAALLGTAEVALAKAHTHAAMGASAAAGAELRCAVALASAAARRHGNLQAAWKLLGDILLHASAIQPPTSAVPQDPDQDTASASTAAAAAAAAGADSAAVQAVRAALQGGAERLEAAKRARRAYAHALHVNPTREGVWGDLAEAVRQQTVLQGSLPVPDGEVREPQQLHNLALARRLLRGGLRLDPTNDWLWGRLGAVATAAAAVTPSTSAAGAAAAGAPGGAAVATDDGSGFGFGGGLGAVSEAEYCYSRALQLNPKRAELWSELGRLYAAHGDASLAARCFDSARSHEPTLVGVWEAMGDAELRKAVGSTFSTAGSTVSTSGGATMAMRGADRQRCVEEALNYFDHAQGLGGELESRLGYAIGMSVKGEADSAPALAAAAKAAAHAPLLAAAHNALALAREARGDLAGAEQALHAALAALDSAGTNGTMSGALVTTLEQDGPAGTPDTRTAVLLNLARVIAQHCSSLSSSLSSSSSTSSSSSSLSIAAPRAVAAAQQQQQQWGPVQQQRQQALARFAELQSSGALQADPAAQLAYAGLLLEEAGLLGKAAPGGNGGGNGVPHALVQVQALAAAATGAAPGSAPQSPQQAQAEATATALLQGLVEGAGCSSKLRLAAAKLLVTALLRSRRWDQAYGVVLSATIDLPDQAAPPNSGAAGQRQGSGMAAVRIASTVDGSSTAGMTLGQQGAQLWFTLLAGAVTGGAPELQHAWLEGLRQWAAPRRDVDHAHIEAQARLLRSYAAQLAAVPPTGALAPATTTPAAAAQARKALAAALHAVHIDPTDRAARARAASLALAISPTRAAAAARTAPPPAQPGAAVTHRHTHALGAGHTDTYWWAFSSAGRGIDGSGGGGVDNAALGAMPGLEEVVARDHSLATRSAALLLAAGSGAASIGGSSSSSATSTAAPTPGPARRGAGSSPGAGVGGSGSGSVGLVAALAVQAAKLRGTVRCQPWTTGAWVLLALTEAQVAQASGGPAHMYRRAYRTARIAASRVQAELSALPQPPAAPTPSPPPAAAGGPPGFAAMPPVMQLYQHAMAAASRNQQQQDPATAALRARRSLLAGLGCRLLALVSECHLHSRTAGAQQRAKDAALEALRLALQNDVDASAAHRQLGRVAVAAGDWPNAENAYLQAVKPPGTHAAAAHPPAGSANTLPPGVPPPLVSPPGAVTAAGSAAGGTGSVSVDLLAALEFACALMRAGRDAQAAEWLANTALSSTTPPSPSPSHMLLPPALAAAAAATAAAATAAASPTMHLSMVASVQQALALLQQGEAEVARQAATALLAAPQAAGNAALAASAAAAAGGVMAEDTRAVALLVQGTAALARCTAAAAAAGSGSGGDGGDGDGGDDAGALTDVERRRLLLEARWCSREALKLSSASSSNAKASLASLLLARVEAQMGKLQLAAEALQSAAASWPTIGTANGSAVQAVTPAELEVESADASLLQGVLDPSTALMSDADKADVYRKRLAAAVHAFPWHAQAWHKLVAASRRS